MNTLCTYIEKKWIRAVGAEKMSIFGLPNSIHNHIQTFNNDLKNAIGTANTIWHMLGMLTPKMFYLIVAFTFLNCDCIAENLTYIATRTFVKVNKRQKNPEQPKQQKRNQQSRGYIINDVTQLWIRTPVHLRSPLYFLQLTSHCINDAIYYASLEDIRNKRKTMDDGEVKAKSNCRQITNREVSTSANSNLVTVSSNMPNVISNTTILDASINRYSSNPPPLVFFPKVKTVERKVEYRLEPPPLVPISGKR